MKDLQINPLFKSLIPPLTKEEYSLLQKSIDEDGCRNPLAVWNGTIIDGHNRYEICRDLEVEFEIDEWQFESEQEAMLWIIDNQLGRRNLSDYQKVELARKKKQILAGKGKEKQREAGKQYGEKHPKQEVLSTVNKSSHDSRKEIAKEAGVSSATVARAEVLMKEASEETKEKLRRGEIKIGTAYKQLREEELPSETKSLAFAVNDDDIELAKYSWGPVTGCKYGCSYCYAKDEAMRFTGHFNPEFHVNKLNAPYNTAPDKKNNRVLLCPTADLFCDCVPAEQIQKIIDMCRDTPQWTYLCLTNNPERYLDFIFPENMWLGITCDTQQRFEISMPIAYELKERNWSKEWQDKGWGGGLIFVSFEPLKEKIALEKIKALFFDWVIIGSQNKITSEPEFQPEWAWVESLLFAMADRLPVYFKSNLTVRPKQLPWSGDTEDEDENAE